jgi:Subtilase family
MSNRRSVFSDLVSAHGMRALLSALLFAAFIIVGCGQTSTKPNVDETCLADKPELRYWLRDRIAVSVQLPVENGALADQDIASNVAKSLREQAGTQLDFVAPLIRVGQNATIFYQLPGNNAKNKCDSAVLSAVNNVNRAIATPPTQGDPASNSIAPSEELHPLKVLVGGQTVAVSGASPDWILSGAPVGNGDGGGRPGGPAKIPLPGFSPNDAKDLAVANGGDGGANTAVVVLDTGYKLGAAHQDPGGCPGAAQGRCAPAVQDVRMNSTVAAALTALYGTPLGDLGEYLQESDMALQTDTPYNVTNNGGHGLPITGVPYELTDANGDPASVVDHGLYISGLIHEAAPKAQIRLIRVLNDYGIGDLQSILIGVQTVAGNPDAVGKLLNIDQKRRIVVNMSLGFGPPADCLIGVWNHWTTLQQGEDSAVQKNGQASPASINCVGDRTPASATPATESDQPYRTDLEQLVLGNGGAHAALTLPLSLAVSTLRRVNPSITAVVAAAGNESASGVHLDADLPSAICGVIPVGATDATGLARGITTRGAGGLELVGFSNRPLMDTSTADTPRLCLDIRGGREVGASITVTFAQMGLPSMVAVGANVCGVYASPVPPMAGTPSATPSSSHMALWDGTSFATGWASGYVARQGVPANDVFFVPDRQPCNAP